MNMHVSTPLINADLNSIEQMEFYRLLVASIQDYAIFLLDTKGNVASWNIGAQKLKGYMPEEIIGKHFSIFYTPEDLAKEKPRHELEDCLKYGRIEDEYWRLKKGGGRFWANVVITALYDTTGQLIGFAKVTRDLTERKAHEDELQIANTKLQDQQVELEALNSAKDEFISLASHQLRTPATGVKQFLGLMLEGYAGTLTDQQQDYLQKAYDSNNRQIDLVNNLLRVAQADAGKVVLVKAPTDIGALVKDVINEQADSFKNRRQSVKVSVGSQPIMAVVDELRFRMVLENLIDNASKYTPVGGKISITITSTDMEVTVTITDTGVGIDDVSLMRLFTKFSRIPNELSESVGGSGLGLYWAQKVVELHGGTIVVTSELGKGSVFKITIPKGEGNA